MDQTEQEQLAKRIREEIDERGSEANPAYLEEVLRANIVGLLRHVQEDLQAISRPFAETVYNAQRYEELPDGNTRGTLDLGTRILISHLKKDVFILHEIQARICALDVQQEKQQLL